MTTANKKRFLEACEAARIRSLRPEYKGCGVHVVAYWVMEDGEPKISGYRLSDWTGDMTVASYVNGQPR